MRLLPGPDVVEARHFVRLVQRYAAAAATTTTTAIISIAAGITVVIVVAVMIAVITARRCEVAIAGEHRLVADTLHRRRVARGERSGGSHGGFLGGGVSVLTELSGFGAGDFTLGDIARPLDKLGRRAMMMMMSRRGRG